MNCWIYTDADNTLWDTDKVFEDAQLEMLQSVEELVGRRLPDADRLAFVREFDQEIAARHHLGLRYPPSQLVQALSVGLLGVSAGSVAKRVVDAGVAADSRNEEIAERFLLAIGKDPQLLPTVSNALEFAKSMAVPVFVVTEGPLDTAKRRLRVTNIEDLVSGIHSATKTVTLYMRLAERARPCRAVMIGDQSDKDIRLAREAGLDAILVRGRFRPKWANDTDVLRATYVAGSFLDAVAWVVDAATR